MSLTEKLVRESIERLRGECKKYRVRTQGKTIREIKAELESKKCGCYCHKAPYFSVKACGACRGEHT